MVQPTSAAQQKQKEQSSKPALRELQLKALSLPTRERVQSAKSSTTNQQNLSSQSNQRSALNQVSNAGALSHRES